MKRVSEGVDRLLQAIVVARAAAVHAERLALAALAAACADLTRLAMEAGR